MLWYDVYKWFSLRRSKHIGGSPINYWIKYANGTLLEMIMSVSVVYLIYGVGVVYLIRGVVLVYFREVSFQTLV